MSRLPCIAAIALASLSAPPAMAQKPAQYVVALWSHAYAPNPIRLRAGQPVTMTFVNRAGKSHDFTAPEFFAAARITAGAAPRGEIDLRGGETKSLTLVPARGTYRVHCSRFLHAAMGMTGTIVVQ